VVTDFAPDVTLPVPRLCQIAFSADEDFLVISGESGGGLAVFAVDDLLQQKKEPELQIETANTPVRAIRMNPNPEFAHYALVVLESGRMDLVDITSKVTTTIQNEGVTCASWSTKGKAFVAGLADGTAIAFKVGDKDAFARIPRPKNPGEGYTGKCKALLSRRHC
jgi:nucleoporin NUP159